MAEIVSQLNTTSTASLIVQQSQFDWRSHMSHEKLVSNEDARKLIVTKIELDWFLRILTGIECIL